MMLSKKCLAIPEDTWLPTWISNRPSSWGATSPKPAWTWPWSQFKFSKPLYTTIRNVVGRPLVIVNFVLAQPCPLSKERQTLPFLRPPFEGIHPNWIWTNVYLFPHRVIHSLSLTWMRLMFQFIFFLQQSFFWEKPQSQTFGCKLKWLELIKLASPFSLPRVWSTAG